VSNPLHADLIEIGWFVRPHGQDDRGGGDLGAAEIRALATAAGGCCGTIQDIARALGVTRSGATRVVDRLERSGLVSRCCSEIDRRCTSVEITTAGRTALAAASRRFAERLDPVLAPLAESEREELRRALALLAGLLRNRQER